MSIVIRPVSSWVAWLTANARTFCRLSGLAVWRPFAAYLLVAAFAFQGYVTQSHIHVSSVPRISGKSEERGVLNFTGNAGGDIGKQQQRDQFPATDDPSNCPICQQIPLAGHFLAAQAISPIPLQTISSDAFIGTDAVVLISAMSHAWRGRAPPKG
jgi:hypothetical protein